VCLIRQQENLIEMERAERERERDLGMGEERRRKRRRIGRERENENWWIWQLIFGRNFWQLIVIICKGLYVVARSNNNQINYALLYFNF